MHWSSAEWDENLKCRNLHLMLLRLLWFITDLSGLLYLDYNLLLSTIFWSLWLCTCLSRIFGLYLGTCETDTPSFPVHFSFSFVFFLSISHHLECLSSVFSLMTKNEINESNSLAVCVSVQISVFPQHHEAAWSQTDGQMDGSRKR